MTRTLRDGDALEFRDRTLRIYHRPGHSPSDTVFWDEERSMLIAGDHLLARISSNPLISRPLVEDPTRPAEQPRPRALLQYMDSLRATREQPVQTALPGHGEPVLDHEELIDERLRMHRRRAARILQILGADSLSAYEIALQMWGNVAVTQAYLTLSEVLGHLDLLVESGQALERESGGTSRFAAR